MSVWHLLWLVFQTVLGVTLCIAWIAGFVIAQGFWSTLFCWFPIWSWYLCVEKVMTHLGML